MSAINLSSDTKSWKRIMLKLSGEALVGKQKYGLDPEKIASRNYVFWAFIFESIWEGFGEGFGKGLGGVWVLLGVS